MGIKLLFFTGFSKFVAHESVAFMLVLFSCYSRCLLIFWGDVYSGLVRIFFSFICFMVTLYLLLVCFQSVSNSLYSALSVLSRHSPAQSVVIREIAGALPYLCFTNRKGECPSFL